jgi:hypothetical protein
MKVDEKRISIIPAISARLISSISKMILRNN